MKNKFTNHKIYRFFFRILISLKMLGKVILAEPKFDPKLDVNILFNQRKI